MTSWIYKYGIKCETKRFKRASRKFAKEVNQVVDYKEIGRTYWMGVKDGKVLQGWGDACTHPSNKIGCDRYVTFHPNILNRVDEFVNYVINSPLFGGVYKTKSAEEGFQTGFEIDVNQPYNLVKTSLINLRTPFENPHHLKGFLFFKDEGFDEHLSYYLGTLLSFSFTEKINSYIYVCTNEHGYESLSHTPIKNVYEGIYGKVDKGTWKDVGRTLKDVGRSYTCYELLRTTEEIPLQEFINNHPEAKVLNESFGLKFYKVVSNKENLLYIANELKKEVEKWLN